MRSAEEEGKKIIQKKNKQSYDFWPRPYLEKQHLKKGESLKKGRKVRGVTRRRGE